MKNTHYLATRGRKKEAYIMEKSFIFYESYKQALDTLGNSLRLQFYDAITAYAFDGTEPVFNGKAKIAWQLIKHRIDSGKEQ